LELLESVVGVDPQAVVLNRVTHIHVLELLKKDVRRT